MAAGGRCSAVGCKNTDYEYGVVNEAQRDFSRERTPAGAAISTALPVTQREVRAMLSPVTTSVGTDVGSDVDCVTGLGGDVGRAAGSSLQPTYCLGESVSVSWLSSEMTLGVVVTSGSPL